MTDIEDEKITHICPHCHSDLFDVGVIEAIMGGYSETRIHFSIENNGVEIGETSVKDFDDQEALCGSCREHLPFIAVEYIDLFNGEW